MTEGKRSPAATRNANLTTTREAPKVVDFLFADPEGLGRPDGLAEKGIEAEVQRSHVANLQTLLESIDKRARQRFYTATTSLDYQKRGVS